MTRTDTRAREPREVDTPGWLHRPVTCPDGAGTITARRWEGHLFRWQVMGQFWREGQLIVTPDSTEPLEGISRHCGRRGLHYLCGGTYFNEARLLTVCVCGCGHQGED